MAASTPRDSNTRRPTQRIFVIHSEILKGGLPNCSTLAAHFGVTPKTIQRDINFMRNGLGLPVVYCNNLHDHRYDGTGGACRLNRQLGSIDERGFANHKDAVKQLRARHSIRNMAKISGNSVSTVQQVKAAMPPLERKSS